MYVRFVIISLAFTYISLFLSLSGCSQVVRLDTVDGKTPLLQIVTRCVQAQQGLVFSSDLVAYYFLYYIGRQRLLDEEIGLRLESEECKALLDEIIHLMPGKDSIIFYSALYHNTRGDMNEYVLPRDCAVNFVGIPKFLFKGRKRRWQQLREKISLLREKVVLLADYCRDVENFLSYIIDLFPKHSAGITSIESDDGLFWSDIFSLDSAQGLMHGYFLRLVPGADLPPIYHTVLEPASVDDPAVERHIVSGINSYKIEDGWLEPLLTIIV